MLAYVRSSLIKSREERYLSDALGLRHVIFDRIKRERQGITAAIDIATPSMRTTKAAIVKAGIWREIAAASLASGFVGSERWVEFKRRGLEVTFKSK